jgi:methionyl-tRNA formyltransferase
MKKKSKTIIFFGNERLATGVTTEALTLKSLLKEGYDVAAVIVNQDYYKSRSVRVLEVETFAQKNNIPILRPPKLSEIKDELASFGAEAGVLAAYGKIIPTSIIDIFPRGIINIHPSLLPHGRGPTPIEQVILDGAGKTGVSIMQLVQDMDAGPVFGQAELRLSGIETKQQLADSLLALGNKLLISYLPAILSGEKIPSPQDNSQATYNDLIKKDDAKIDWSQPAEQIERQIRAYSIWPKSRAQLAGMDLIIIQARVSQEVDPNAGEIVVKGNQLFIGTGKSALEITSLQPVNKAVMSAPSFLAGYAQLLTKK